MKKLMMAIAFCFLLLTPAGVVALPNGTVVQVAGDDALYLIINGFASHIPSGQVYGCMGLQKNRTVKMSAAQLAQLPKAAFLVRGSDGRIFRVDGTVRRHVVNQNVFKRKGFTEQQVIDIADRALNCIPEGPPIK